MKTPAQTTNSRPPSKYSSGVGTSSLMESGLTLMEFRRESRGQTSRSSRELCVEVRQLGFSGAGVMRERLIAGGTSPNFRSSGTNRRRVELGKTSSSAVVERIGRPSSPSRVRRLARGGRSGQLQRPRPGELPRVDCGSPANFPFHSTTLPETIPSFLALMAKRAVALTGGYINIMWACPGTNKVVRSNV